MDLGSGIFLALDLVSALLEIGVAIYFFVLWNTSRAPLHLLFAVGLALVGVSYSVVSASEFQLGGSGLLWDHFRLAGQTGGALVILAAYWSARGTGHAQTSLAIGYALAGVTLLFAILFFAVPPTFAFRADRDTFIVAHTAMILAWAGCAWLAFPRSSATFTRARVLVPAAFLFFAVAKYAWLMEDIVEDTRLIPFIYPWRFLGLACLVAAVSLRSPRKEAPGDAP